LDPSNFFASSSSSAAALETDFDLMSLGLDVGSSSSGRGRGILSGNVPQFRYQDYEDDEGSDVDAPRY